MLLTLKTKAHLTGCALYIGFKDIPKCLYFFSQNLIKIAIKNAIFASTIKLSAFTPNNANGRPKKNLLTAAFSNNNKPSAIRILLSVFISYPP